jgi:hypothetical protein
VEGRQVDARAREVGAVGRHAREVREELVLDAQRLARDLHPALVLPEAREHEDLVRERAREAEARLGQAPFLGRERAQELRGLLVVGERELERRAVGRAADRVRAVGAAAGPAGRGCARGHSARAGPRGPPREVAQELDRALERREPAAPSPACSSCSRARSRSPPRGAARSPRAASSRAALVDLLQHGERRPRAGRGFLGQTREPQDHGAPVVRRGQRERARRVVRVRGAQPLEQRLRAVERELRVGQLARGGCACRPR